VGSGGIKCERNRQKMNVKENIVKKIENKVLPWYKLVGARGNIYDEDNWKV
jgi:hypothetical protein